MMMLVLCSDTMKVWRTGARATGPRVLFNCPQLSYSLINMLSCACIDAAPRQCYLVGRSPELTCVLCAALRFHAAGFTQLLI